jgi:hypothetical protein
MITCFLEYRIDPKKTSEFERYGRMWIKLIERFGGVTTAISSRARATVTPPLLYSASRA